jgi:predicted Zn-dependent protease
MGLLLLTLTVIACATVPGTNRSQLSLVGDAQMNQMALTEYRQFLSQNPPASNNTSDGAMVKRAGARIATAVTAYMAELGRSDAVAGFEWEFNLVNGKEVNAWCMPGGKVVVYTGLLPITQTEDGLAVVMGHEIAHAVARHGNERMSQQLATQLGGQAMEVALANKRPETRAMWGAALGLGAQFGVMLPFSRTHESEADRLGLLFMAKAGYDPRAAVPFWERMAAGKQGGGPPEFMSTHPSDATRIRQIQEWMPEALALYPGKR